MKILPMVRRSVPLLVTVDDVQRCIEVPLQAILMPNGLTVLRLGDNTLWWDAQGRFDGVEAKAYDPCDRPTLDYATALEAMVDHDTAPDEPYFGPHSDGQRAEMRGWPKADRKDAS